MNPRILAVVLDGHEAAMVAGMPTLVALARAREATVRVAYFRPIPDPRVDRYDCVVADSDREMTRIGRDRKSTRLNSSHIQKSRMPSSA